jgi:transcription elongation GreA/GreB family factor
MGKAEGDEVSISLPSGVQEFEILEVGYKPIEFKE